MYIYVLLPTSPQPHSPAPSLTPLAFRLFLQYAGSVHFRTLRLLFPLARTFPPDFFLTRQRSMGNTGPFPKVNI